MAVSADRGGEHPVTPDTPKEPTPVVPVRSAPLRRKPKAKAPKVKAPEAKAPKAKAPEAKAPEVKPPEVTASETASSEPVEAESVTVDSGVPDDGSTDAVVGELSYRERRRRRQASAPTQASGEVRRSSAIRRRTDRSVASLVTITLAVVVVVGCLVASAVCAVGLHRIDHDRELRAEYSSFAQQMTITMAALNPGNIDAAMKTMQDNTSGVAQQRLQQSMSQVADLVREMKDAVTAAVMTAAVTKATDDEGTVIMVYGWQSKPQDPKQETILQTYRWRVEITRINGELKMTNYDWVV